MSNKTKNNLPEFKTPPPPNPPTQLPPPTPKIPYSPAPPLGKDGLLVHRPGQSRTVQAGAEELNINMIVQRAFQTGTIPTLNYRTPQFGDATAIPNSLQEVLQRKANASQAFASLPKQLQQELNHDPNNLPAWIADPRNAALAKKWGLLKPDAPIPPKPKPTEVILVNPKDQLTQTTIPGTGPGFGNEPQK